MSQNEYVFLICQDKRTRKVITIEDHRDRLEAEKLATSQTEKNFLTELWKNFRL